jgi:beta-lactamase class A
MFASRRLMITTLLAAGLGTVGCHGKVNPRPKVSGLDLDRLNRDFPALAARARPGRFNLAVMSLGEPGVWSADEAGRYPLQDLAALPIAAAALSAIDAKELTLNERLPIRAVDLSPPPSRINSRFPLPAGAGSIDLPVADLIALAVQERDATAADAVLRRVGGPGGVTAWLVNHKVNDVRLDRYQREIQVEMSGMASFRAAWKDASAFASARASLAPETREAAMANYLRDPRDTATGPGLLNLIQLIAVGGLLSRPSTALLLRLMAARPTDLLGGGLPRDAALDHLGASSDTDLGYTAAAGDIGVITLANGRRLAVAALLSGSTASAPQRQTLFADASRTAISALS